MARDVDSTRVAPIGVFDSAKHLLASIAAHLHTRLELFSTELAEEKVRLIRLLYSAVTVLFIFCTTLALALLFVVAAYWDTPYRLHVIGGLFLLFSIAAGIGWSRVRAQLQSRPHIFEASLAELYKDKQHLDSPQ